ncbi:MAG: prepilin-type N-terminal cleavage/methylation domain-containing protein [Planctomycetota bacterium]
MAPRRSRESSAFSLIELVVVIAILATLTGIASMSLRGHLQNSNRERCFQKLQSADSLARIQARQMNVSDVRLRFENDHVELLTKDSRGSRSERKFPMLAGTRLEMFDFVGDLARGMSQDEIRLNRRGRSASYALKVDSGASPFWFVVLGGSGQCLQLATQEQVEELLRGK